MEREKDQSLREKALLEGDIRATFICAYDIGSISDGWFRKELRKHADVWLIAEGGRGLKEAENQMKNNKQLREYGDGFARHYEIELSLYVKGNDYHMFTKFHGFTLVEIADEIEKDNEKILKRLEAQNHTNGKVIDFEQEERNLNIFSDQSNTGKNKQKGKKFKKILNIGKCSLVYNGDVECREESNKMVLCLIQCPGQNFQHDKQCYDGNWEYPMPKCAKANSIRFLKVEGSDIMKNFTAMEKELNKPPVPQYILDEIRKHLEKKKSGKLNVPVKTVGKCSLSYDGDAQCTQKKNKRVECLVKCKGEKESDKRHTAKCYEGNWKLPVPKCIKVRSIGFMHRGGVQGRFNDYTALIEEADLEKKQRLMQNKVIESILSEEYRQN